MKRLKSGFLIMLVLSGFVCGCETSAREEAEIKKNKAKHTVDINERTVDIDERTVDIDERTVDEDDDRFKFDPVTGWEKR